MSNARDDMDGLKPGRKRQQSPIYAPPEEIGQMHFSAENYTTAIEYFQKALEHPELQDYPDRFRLYLRLSDCYRRRGRYAQASRYLTDARATLPEEAPADALGKVEYREGFILLQADGNYDEALKRGFSAYRRLKHSAEHGEVAYVQLLLATCYQRLGLITEAEDFYMDSLSSYRRIDDQVGVSYVYNSLGLLHKNACRWNRALASLSKAYELAKSLGTTQHQISVQLNMGAVYAKLRKFNEAQSAFSSCASTAERFGDHYKLTKAILMLGRTHVQCGEFCKAEKSILRGQAMANDYGYARESALADEYLGELMTARGKPREAVVNLEKGLKKARRLAPRGDVVAEILRRMADASYMLGDIDRAIAHASEGLEIAEACGEYYELGYFHRTLALCRRRKGEIERAAASLDASIAAFDQHGNPYEKFRSQRLLSRIYLRSGDRESLVKAKQVLSETTVGFGKIEESREQMLSHVLLAVVEERLGSLDDALLSIYEAERLAEEEHDAKYQKILPLLRGRIEGRMTRDTRRVLEQFPMIGELQSGSRSREKLVAGLRQSLAVVVEKLNARGGFVAIPKARNEPLDVVCRQDVGKTEARAVLAWFGKRHPEGGSANGASSGLVMVDAEREADLALPGKNLAGGLGRLICQGLGFENDALGVIVAYQDRATHPSPVSQEALHFVAAYGRLVSLSVYEMLRNERRREARPRSSPSGFESIVTENQEMIKLLNLAERVAHSNATVLLQGETGTGKGLIAYAVHLLSDRRDKRFVHVNCAAMPETLLESELFGHVKGAFTGAFADKDGLLHQAHGGTIFLDEIGKTSLAMQGKLLQFLDSGKVRRVGSNDLVSVDVRVVCASKSDLLAMCHEGRFLEDFFYRINDFPLTVPPLRERKEDIEILFFHYLRKYADEMGKRIPDATEEALELVKGFHWPGNVRELDKAVKRAVILADDDEPIGVAHLPPEVVGAGGNGRSRDHASTLRDRVERVERDEIRSALERCAWNKSRAAIELGISYPSLLSKIKRYNIRTY